ncbi:hypothetical protein [Burkholderia cepacia]|uniref:hypothetical protein n=1 Tax=Burkholderia cepacia TaxID=292 RepID=UPI003B56079C
MNQEEKRFGDAVAAYLEPHVGILKEYKWKMGKGVPKEAAKLGLITVNKEGGVAATNALRSDVARKAREVHLLAGNTRQLKMNELCKFVICQWGGLGSNQDDTIEAYARLYTNAAIPDLSAICSLHELRVQSNCNFPFKGIASWSKWLNFVWSEWALIYDARIAFALNAIHVMKGVDARAFPVPPGRDKLLSTLDSQTLAALSYLKRQRKHIPDVQNGEYVNALADWLKSGTIAEGDAYEFYLMVMRRVQDVIGRASFPAFVDVEMLLFHLSNRQIVQDFLLLMSDSIRRV